jgi:hypothetical protein
MAKGGAREGSGRKKGSASAKTRAIADKAAKDGVTPLEVMLEAMKFSMDQVKATESPIEKKLFYEAAHAHAKDAAPYIHPKLTSVEVKNPPGETFKTENLSQADKEIIDRHNQNLLKGAKT